MPIILFLLAGVIVFIVFVAIRGSSRRLPGPPAVRRLETRSARDGFWIHSGGLRQGTPIRYQCMVRGQIMNQVVHADGGHQAMFVYTGGTPVEIRLLDADAEPLGDTAAPDFAPSPQYERAIGGAAAGYGGGDGPSPQYGEAAGSAAPGYGSGAAPSPQYEPGEGGAAPGMESAVPDTGSAGGGYPTAY